MKNLQKTSLALAIGALAIASPYTYAVEYALNGELAVELTDSEDSDDAGLDVTTTDLVLTITETFGDFEVEGFIAYELDDDEDDGGLASDGAGITVSGAFGSVFVGDDGTGVFVGDSTDVLYNNSEVFFADPTTNVIDYGLPLSGPFSLNVFVDVTEGDEEDIDAMGAYGSVSLSGFTFALGYTDLAGDGAYGAAGAEDDEILDAAINFESGPFGAGFGYQDQDSEDDEVMSLFLSYSAGNFTAIPYYEEKGDLDVTALHLAYNFTENFYIFFETASYEEDDQDNSEVGLVLTF